MSQSAVPNMSQEFAFIYCLRRAEVDDRNKQIEILENFVRKINLEKKKQSQVKFTYKRCFMETFIIANEFI